MVRAAIILFPTVMFFVGAYDHATSFANSAAVGSPFLAIPLGRGAPARPQTRDVPNTDVGITIEQAYAAIPHHRTVWVETDSPIPSKERAHLAVIFQVLDQAVAVRVAGQQNFSSQRFDDPDIVGDYSRLIDFVRSMTVPSTLISYHKSILAALSGQRQFFADWKDQRDKFQFARQVGNHPGVRKASGALRAAYDQLMSKYRNETPTNKAAFYDYHCALDFL
jgi:hypothetical protein